MSFWAPSFAAARRIESAEAASARESAQIAEAQFGPAAHLDIAGGVAAFLGVGSPLTHVVNPWLTVPASAQDLDAIERFYAGFDCPVNIELASTADPAALELLGSRGYRVVEINQVLVRDLPAEIQSPWVDTRLSVATPEQTDLWSSTMIAGFIDRTDLTQEERKVGQVLAMMNGCRPWMAWVHDEPVATGAWIAREGVAHFFCDSTLRGARGAGLQSALIWGRLVEAVESGCDIATASTLPGSQSQKNYERFGFRPVYCRLNLQKG